MMRNTVLVAFLLTFVVVVLGAWVRLSDAGLGCPDWPGCYGVVTVPQSDATLARAAEVWPDRPVDAGKAWREMIHRYAAGALGLIVFALAFVAFRRRREPGMPWKLALGIAVLIVFQALLGMWTVTLLLKPAVVMAHLLGGVAILSLLWLMWLRLGRALAAPPIPAARGLAYAALTVVVLQIALGGWTSANYAALACPDFPTCQAEWWPNMDFDEAFVLWRGLGVDYEGGVLDSAARTAIHMTHRIGAVVTLLFVGAFALTLWLQGGHRVWRVLGAAIGAALVAQVTIGVLTVVKGHPLAVATLHNAGGALLLLTVVSAAYAAARNR